ncbi:MAG: class 1 fructose-bisphosphatase [Nitrospira sp.]|nr:class 1 fructose-bisphosphatase [Nitrospira sp.]
MVSLTRHIFERQRLQPDGADEFFTIMNRIVSGGKRIARDLRQAGLTDSLGLTDTRNVHGEQVQRMDARANELFVEAFQDSGIVQIVVSEEMDEPFVVAAAEESGKYAVFFDPLDGSSNIDVNAPLGSIFSIHRLDPTGNFLKAGCEQVAGGYLLYGASTILVYTCGEGVHQFTLDPVAGEFFLSASNVEIPPRGKIYSANEGNSSKWSKSMRNIVDYFRAEDKETGRPYSSRYTGCLVADVHRILLKGGLYLYPGEGQRPEGKLRLMYESAPLSFVVEQAGGLGSTGVERIAGIHPKTPHQCVPLVIGSREDVEVAEHFLCRE